jgi:hypothetical protein
MPVCVLENNDNIQIYILLDSKLSYNFIVGIGFSSTRAFFIKPIIFSDQLPLRMHHSSHSNQRCKRFG